MNQTKVWQLERGWVSQPSGRGTLDIIWSCFFTVFVCTFTVLHLNLPSKTETFWQIQIRKIKWMVFAIVIPEVVTASAFAQRVAARGSVAAMRANGYERWSLRHAFYANMGGVMLHLRDHDPFPINATQLGHLVSEKIIEYPTLTGKEIWDKSKSDKFAKGLACLQIGWLSLQCVGRVIQHLPISLLEIATAGFAIPSLATFLLWFNKPCGVETPTVLALDMSTEDLLKRLKVPADYVWRDTPLDIISTVNGPSFVSEIVVKAKGWPMRERFIGHSTRIRNDVLGLKYSKLDQLFVLSVWIGYAGVHLSAWNSVFPSHTERILWRTSCLIMTGSMVVFWITGNRKFYLLIGYIMPSQKQKMEKISSERQKVSRAQIVLGAFTAFSYLVARICLIMQALISLRALPRGAFQDLNWENFLPHI